MSVSLQDPRVKLAYSFDESQALGTRRNAGSAGAVMDLDFSDDSNHESAGLPPVSDGRGGKALNIKANYGLGGATSLARWLSTGYMVPEANLEVGVASRITGVNDPSLYMPDSTEILDGVTDGTGFSFGFRFKYDGTTGTGFGSDIHEMWGWHLIYPASAEDHTDGPWTDSESAVVLGVYLRPNTNSGPADAARLSMRWNSLSTGPISELYPESGAWSDVYATYGWDQWDGYATANYPIELNEWYRVVVSVWQYDDGGTTRVQCRWHVYRESVAEKYVIELSSPGTWNSTSYGSWASADFSSYALGLQFAVGCPIGNGDYRGLEGYFDELWFAEFPFTDPDDVEDFLVSGLSIPWTAPDYEVLGNRVRVAVTNERSSFPPTRPLPTNATAVSHPAGSYGTRPRLRYEGFEPNRPWNIREIELVFDSGGRRKGKTNNQFTYDDFTKGLVRLPGRKVPGTMSDVRNMEFSGFGVRRRRGFKVIETDGYHTNRTPGGFYSFRNTGDELHRILLTNGTLYQDTGGALSSISTGWSSTVVPSFLRHGDRCAVLTPDKRVLWDGASAEAFDGEAAPTGGSAAVSGAGTLAGTFYYAYTFYDPSTGDETAPAIISGSVSPSTQGVLLSSLDNSPTEARFTQQRIYRTVAGGAAPDFYLTATQSLATTYNDTGDANGTIKISEVNGTYTTLVPPENFGFGVWHEGRAFYAGGDAGDRVYRSEAGTLNRFQADAYTAHGGPVRALASRGSQLVVFTDHTVEVIESDWVRDSNGATFETITVLSDVVGAPGHASVCDANDEIFWIDWRGFYTLQGDKVVKLSPMLDNWFQRINWGQKARFVASWNHIRNQIWVCLAHDEVQSNNAVFGTQLVYQIGSGQFSVYDFNAVFVRTYDDDLNGLKFGLLDEFGVWKELESYESDGLEEVTEATHYHTDATHSLGAVTCAGKTWTTDEFRGYGVVLRNSTTGALYYRTIKSNTATVLTLDESLSSSESTVDVYIGGIDAYFELAEVQMGTTNRKMSRQLHSEFDDLTREDNK